MDGFTPQQPVAGFCPNCGAAAQPGGAFCGNCGTKLAAPEVEQPVAQPVEQPTFEPQQPAAEPVTQPVAEPVAQPAAEQPTFEPLSQPAGDPAQPFMPEAAPVAQPQQPFGAQPAQPQQPFGAQPSMPQQPDQGFGAPVPPMNFQQPKQSGGVGALVCGILAILFGLLSPIIGVILGIVAIVLAKKGGGKAKIARICGIAGIVVSALMFAIGLFVGLSVFDEIMDDQLDSPSSSLVTENEGTSVDSVYNIDSDLYLDESSQQAAEEVAAMFAAIEKGENAALQEIADIADQGFYAELDFHMDDCDFAPMDYAKGMTSGFEYEVVSVVLDEAEGTGWIGVDIDAKDIFTVLDKFNDSIDELDASGRVEGMTEAEIKAELGKMLSDAISATPVTDDVNYAIIDVEKVNGEWVVDMESWDFEIDYMFGLV